LIIYGALIHSRSLSEIQCLPQALLAVSQTSGKIEWLIEDVDPSQLQEAVASKGWSLEDPNTELIMTKEGEFILPGFVDTHTVGIVFEVWGSREKLTCSAGSMHLNFRIWAGESLVLY
jgi:guanine deaminase